MKLVLLLALVSGCAALYIQLPVYALAAGGPVLEFGVLEYVTDDIAGLSLFQITGNVATDVPLRFGAKKGADYEWFAYTQLGSPAGATLVAWVEDQEVVRLLLVGGEPGEVKVVVKSASEGAQPLWDAPVVDSKGKIAAPVASSAASQDEQQPEEEKLFVQRNWMYIVPPLVLFMLMPQQEEPAAAPAL